MSVLSSLIFILISILFISAFDQQQLNNDNMCDVKGGVLCVKDELMIIATVAKSIIRKTNEIEKFIKQTKVLETLNRYVNLEMNFTHLQLPSLQYHIQLCQTHNIDKKYLSNLFFEAHNAMMFYYNSIIDLLNLQVIFAEKTDEWFKQIQYNISDEIICRYRRILYIYSQEWSSVNKIDRLEFSKKHRFAASLTHDVYSIVIARYLRELMEHINNTIVHLNTRFS